MMDHVFATPLGVVELVTPLLSVGVFLPGFFLFGYMLHRAPSDLYTRTLVISGVAFVYVLGESLVIILGSILHLQSVSVQVARVQQVAVGWLIPAIPYYLGAALTTTTRLRGMNRAMIGFGIALAAAATVIAFVAPDLLRSVTLPHATAFEIESTFGRGARGPLTRYRDLALFVVIIYANIIILLELVTYRITRFSLTLMAGLLMALGFAILSLLDSIVGPFSTLYPRSVVGITLFVLASTLAATWRFIDEAREVETAHTELQTQEKRLSYLAYHDQLTGARNRKAFYEVLVGRSQSARTGAGPGIALFYLDLDYFKQVNDTYGHRVGDLLLRRVAEQLQTGIRQSDALFRIGGDEFAMIVETAPDGAELSMIAEKLLSTFRDPIPVDGREFAVGVSIGAAIMPTHTTSVEDLMNKADQALYAAKQERNAFRLYHDRMDATPAAAVELLDQLRMSIERREFAIHYQPVVRADGSVFAVEALLRWQPQDGRTFAVDAVVDLAEAAGLMGSTGELILDTALRETAPYLVSGKLEYVAVNVSPRQVGGRKFSESVREAVARHGVSLDQLRLEVKEGDVFDSLPIGGGRIVSGAGEGLRFTVDDFGKGYSSLAYLRRLSIDSLKLDREIVTDITTDSLAVAFVRGLLAMTAELGMDVIAKGVETDEQSRALVEAGCSFFQGFLTGRPGPIDSVFG
ncbi:MAG: EAL domain-containing protein [Spirochaetales bacterium]|nr:EAL domain-containing protein [Spirochaetales bacterium]